jgi:hypothetical protein
VLIHLLLEVRHSTLLMGCATSNWGYDSTITSSLIFVPSYKDSKCMILPIWFVLASHVKTFLYNDFICWENYRNFLEFCLLIIVCYSALTPRVHWSNCKWSIWYTEFQEAPLICKVLFPNKIYIHLHKKAVHSALHHLWTCLLRNKAEWNGMPQCCFCLYNVWWLIYSLNLLSRWRQRVGWMLQYPSLQKQIL